MQNFLFKNFIIPAYSKYKKLNRFNYYKELKKRDFLTLEELKEIQYKKLKLLIYHCYYNIPYYNRLFKQLEIHPIDIKNLEDFSKIPILEKQDIRNNFKNLINPNLPENKIFYDSTSGSTGIPLKLARSTEDNEYGFALRYRSNAWCGWEFQHKSVWFVSDTRHITELDKAKGRLALWIKRRLLIDTKKITKKNMYKWVEQIKNFKPAQVYGYSSLLAEFSEFLIDKNINIEGIKGVFSTAETLRKRQTISKAFNAPVYNQYGASEIPCIAHECRHGNMHLNIDEVLVEFIDISESPNIKKLILTPLYLYGMPLLRYDLQDAAVSGTKQCDCGLPYPVIELKIGRISDNILSPKGKLVPGVTLSWYITDATENIKQYQIIQENISDFTIKLVSEEKFRAKNELSIKELMFEMLNTTEINIKFEYHEEILPDSNGKYRPIKSKVQYKS
ncbi:MAG: hypothetical protein V2B14_03475 [bacterium]